MSTAEGFTRRTFLYACGATLLLPTSLRAAPQPSTSITITPLEYMMRQHGALYRILLILDEVRARVQGGKEFPEEALHNAANIVTRYIGGFHEKLEEKYIFPVFIKAGQRVDMVSTLIAQHHIGHRFTAYFERISSAEVRKDPKSLPAYIVTYIKMYQHHAAVEDTVLFQAFYSLESRGEYLKIGKTFEDLERTAFGENGFEKIIAQIAALEKTLSIHDLSQFTPKT